MATVHWDSGFPAVAGALAQLVQVDLPAAENNLINLIDSTFHGPCNGFCRSNRARDMFSPDQVMSAHEELFAELNDIRLGAPDDAFLVKHVSPQIDPVMVFAGFASHPSSTVRPTSLPLKGCRNLCANSGIPFGRY